MGYLPNKGGLSPAQVRARGISAVFAAIAGYAKKLSAERSARRRLDPRENGNLTVGFPPLINIDAKIERKWRDKRSTTEGKPRTA